MGKTEIIIMIQHVKQKKTLTLLLSILPLLVESRLHFGQLVWSVSVASNSQKVICEIDSKLWCHNAIFCYYLWSTLLLRLFMFCEFDTRLHFGELVWLMSVVSVGVCIVGELCVVLFCFCCFLSFCFVFFLFPLSPYQIILFLVLIIVSLLLVATIY